MSGPLTKYENPILVVKVRGHHLDAIGRQRSGAVGVEFAGHAAYGKWRSLIGSDRTRESAALGAGCADHHQRFLVSHAQVTFLRETASGAVACRMPAVCNGVSGRVSGSR